VYVDSTPPTADLIVGIPRYRDQVNHTWNITSDTPLDITVDDGIGCGVDYTEYRIFNLNGTYNSGIQTYFASFNLSGAPFDGNYTIEYTCYDYLGNSQTFYDVIYLDDTPPTTPIVVGIPKHPDSGFRLNVTDTTSFSFSGRTDGPGCGVAFTYYRIYCEDNSTYVTNWITGTSFSFSNFGLDDGNYTIEYYSVDRLGNDEPVNPYYIYLDNTPPQTTHIVGNPRYPPGPAVIWNVTSHTHFYLFSDDGSGSGVNNIVYQIKHYLDPKDWNQIIPNPYNGSYFVIIGPEGNYTIRYRATDNLSNGEPNNEIEIILDNTPPESNITFRDPQYRDNETADILNITSRTPINITSEDGGAIPVGLNTIRFMIDDDFDLSNGNLTGWLTYTGEFNLSGFSDGDYMIYYFADDLLGNTEAINNATIIGDDSPPQTDFKVVGINVSGGADMWWVKPDTDFILTSSDYGTPPVGLNFSEYSINGNWVMFYGGYEIFNLSTSQNGSYTIEYRGVDYLGNAEDPKNATLIMDDAGPTIDIISTPDVILPPILPEIPILQINFSEITNLTINATDTGVPSGVTPSGVDFIQYIIDPEDPNSTWQIMTPGTYNIFELVINWYQNASRGFWHHNISFRAYDNLGWEGPISTIWFYIEGDIEPPLPPELKVYVRGDDIFLKWTPSPSDDIHHYLLYRSESRTDFDFTEPWVDTSQNSDGGVILLRTTWNDTNAADIDSDFYYTIRGVDGRKNTGYTSNIAGKVKLTFEEGYNDFSLPLEPFDDIKASQMLMHEDFIHETDTIYRYDTQLQQWLGHSKFMPSYMDDFMLNFGEGYMVYVEEGVVEYTITGSAGTSIRYIGGAGEEVGFQDSLNVKVTDEGIELSWDSAGNATGYSVYRATARTGDESLTNYSSEPVIELTRDDSSWTDTEASGNEYYYLVVARGPTGEESSTYAVGVRTYNLYRGYSSISLVLEPKTAITMSDFTQRMQSSDSDTIYSYDRLNGTWIGHARFIPESINNGKVVTGRGYMVFTYTETIYFTLIGV
jgi:hypothetical protein